MRFPATPHGPPARSFEHGRPLFPTFHNCTILGRLDPFCGTIRALSTPLRRRPSRDARCLFGPLLVASYDTQGIRGENSFIPSPYPQGTGVTRFDFAKLPQFRHGAPLISKIFPWKTTQIWAWWTPYLQSLAVYCSYCFFRRRHRTHGLTSDIGLTTCRRTSDFGLC